MATYCFDESYYLQSKLAQLKHADAKNASYTLDDLKKALQKDNLTAELHYELYGRSEGLNPNAYFNEAEYLAAKVNQLNSTTGQTWTVGMLKNVLQGYNLSAEEHYARYGAYETDKDGNFINPSNAFDANAYWTAKLGQVRESGENVNGKVGAFITIDDLVQSFKAAGLSPVKHYVQYGHSETGTAAAPNPLVQLVPMGQRVAYDPNREKVTGEVLPGNYNANTPAPKGVANPQPVPYASDMGGLTNDAVFADPVTSGRNATLPNTTGYVAPPSVIGVESDDYQLVAPLGTDAAKASGNWLLVNPGRSTAVVVAQDGTVLGLVDVALAAADGATDERTVSITTAKDVAVGSLAPVPSNQIGDIKLDTSKNNNIGNPATEDDDPPGGSTNADTFTLTSFLPNSPQVINLGGVPAQGTDRILIGANPAVQDIPTGGDGTNIPETVKGILIGGVLGVAGDDRVSLSGTASATLVVGGAESSVINLLGGNNTIDLQYVLAGGQGVVSSGATTLTAGANTSIMAVSLGSGADSVTFNAGAQATSISTGGGNDAVTFNSGAQATTIDLGAGDDAVTLKTSSQAQRIETQDGNDRVTMESGTGVSILNLGNGNDTLTIDSNTQSGSLNGGDGNDTLILTGTTSKTLTAASNFEVLDLSASGSQIAVIGTGLPTGLSVKAGAGDKVEISGMFYIAGSAAEVNDVGYYFYNAGAKTLTYYSGGAKTITFDIDGACSTANNALTWTGTGTAAVRAMGVVDLPDAVDLPGA
jgi:hypothetical protein